MGSDSIEKQLYYIAYISSNCIQSQGQTNLIGLSYDVESDGELRFLMRLRISDRILRYILHQNGCFSINFRFPGTSVFPGPSKLRQRNSPNHLLCLPKRSIYHQGSEEFDVQNRNPLKKPVIVEYECNMIGNIRMKQKKIVFSLLKTNEIQMKLK